MPCLWPVDPGRTARSLVAADGGARQQGAAGLLTTAAGIVDGLHYLYDLDEQVHGERGAPVLGYDAGTVNLAHARWAATDAVAALDVCAAVLGRLLTDDFPCADGREMDLGDALRHPAVRDHADARAWLAEVVEDPCYLTVWELRTDGGPQRLVVDRLLGQARDFATRHVQAFVARAAAGRLRPVA
jgi:hypothetical protein